MSLVTEHNEKLDGMKYIEYLKDLYAKATPDSDVAMIVDWHPHIEELIYRYEVLMDEYEHLKEDYDKLKTLRAKASSNPSSASASPSSPTAWKSSPARSRTQDKHRG